jgi:AcrR family transcriptional regulator
LKALSFGRLADELQMSKSGIAGHFSGFNALVEAVLDAWEQALLRSVIDPARKDEGVARLCTMAEAWAIHWPSLGTPFEPVHDPGDPPAPGAERLLEIVRRWLAFTNKALAVAKARGELAAEADVREIGFDLHPALWSVEWLPALVGAEEATEHMVRTFWDTLDRVSAAAPLPKAPSPRSIARATARSEPVAIRDARAEPIDWEDLDPPAPLAVHDLDDAEAWVPE